jgi:preprotein translocase subunit SecF
MQLIKDTNIDFLGKRYIALVVSTIVIVAGIVSLVTKGGPNYGIDFVGGTEVRVRFAAEPDISRMRDTLSGLGLGEVVLQTFSSTEGVYETLIRVEKIEESIDAAGGEGGHVAAAIIDALRSDEEQSRLDQGLVDLNQSGRDTVNSLLLSSFSEDAEEPAPAEEPAVEEDEAVAEETETDPSSLLYTADDLALDDSGPELVTGSASARDLAAAIIDYRDHTGGLLTSLDDLQGIPGMSERAMQALSKKAFLGSFAVVGVDFVGPTVGYDLRGKAVQAIVWSLIGILAYITFRFKFHWGIGAVAALFHDVMVTVGIFSIFNREFNLTVIAGLLTIVGYSLNDTIVVFDRIRDNLKAMRRSPFPEIVNASINQTLSRTVLTSLTTMLVVLSLLFLGGQVINNFAFALMVGIITGTYSSIFVASPILVFWQKVLDNRSRPGNK